MTVPRLSGPELSALFDELSNHGRWGPHDRLGTLNHLTPERRLAAFALVREGLPVSLASPLATEPAPDNPRPVLHRLEKPGDPGRGMLAGGDRFEITPHGMALTHLDALAHASWRGRLYNGVPLDAVSERGARELDIETFAPGIVGRGVLLDIPRLRGVAWLEPGDAVLPAELDEAQRAAAVRVGPGDLLVVRTGRGARDTALGHIDLSERSAGMHPLCLRWLHARDVALLACDQTNDVVPSVADEVVFPNHRVAIAGMGMPLVDNAWLEDVAAACAARGRAEFLLVIAPLRARGATGIPVNPLAIL